MHYLKPDQRDLPVIPWPRGSSWYCGNPAGLRGPGESSRFKIRPNSGRLQKKLVRESRKVNQPSADHQNRQGHNFIQIIWNLYDRQTYSREPLNETHESINSNTQMYAPLRDLLKCTLQSFTDIWESGLQHEHSGFICSTFYSRWLWGGQMLRCWVFF